MNAGKINGSPAVGFIAETVDTTIDIDSLSDTEALMTGNTSPESPPEPDPDTLRDEPPSDTDDNSAHYGECVFGE
jgi:hypothetical protein